MRPLYPQKRTLLCVRRKALSAFAHTHYSLAQESRVESRIALRGNCPLSGCQTSKNVALTRNDAFATLRCVPITHAHNTVRQCETSWGNLSLLKALEHVVCLHRQTAALFFQFFPASHRCCMSASRLRNIVVNCRN